MRVSITARRAALGVLDRVLTEAGYSSLSLDDMFRGIRLDPRDKRLVTKLVYTTLENLYRIDHALAPFLEDPDSLEPRVRNLLRMGACQILFMDRIPDSAAVNEAVNITRDIGLESLTGLVNGVLRSLIRGLHDIAWPSEEEGARYLSVMYSYPLWLVELLRQAYGEEEAQRIIKYRVSDPAVTIRPNLMRTTAEQFDALLAAKGWRIWQGVMPMARQAEGVLSIADDPDFAGGLFSIQGEGSMAAAEAVGARRGMRILDCCAAPGGKTAYLAEQMQGTGRVYAWDVHPHRVDLIYATAKRLRLNNIRPAALDASVFREQHEGTMDAVLIDAPCSGTGVMHSKPEIKYNITPEGVTALCALQDQLLSVCSRYVKPGGVLVYATCSILPEENTVRTQAFLDAHPEFTVDRLPDTIPDALRRHETGLGLQLMPHRDGTEGFYMIRMRRQ